MRSPATLAHERERRVLSKLSIPPEIQQAFDWLERNFHEDFGPVRDDLVAALRDGTLDPSESVTIRTDIRELIGEYRSDVVTTYTQGTERGANAGVEVAKRRYPLEVSFSVAPDDVLREFATWSEQATTSTLTTLTDDVANLVRGAQEAGHSIDRIAEDIDEMVGKRYVESGSWKSRQLARTATIPSSNAGTHATYREASGVVGEEWVATEDDRTRATHSAADGQVVAPDTTFVVGGATARYPGDPSLPLDEVVNCRCTSIPRFADAFSDSELATLESGGRLYA